MKLKRLIVTALVFGLAITTSVTAAPRYSYEVKVNVNKVEITSDVKPFIDTSTYRTYVPIRFVSQALGEKVDWNNKTKTVSVVKRSGKKISLSPGKKVAYVDGAKQIIDAAPIEVKNRVMVPLRFISEQLGAKVDLKKENGFSIVDIYYADAPTQPGTDKPGTDKPNNGTYVDFELDAKYKSLAPYLFKDNMHVEKGELVFTVPKLARSGASLLDWGKNDELKQGKEYRFKLGDKGYISFYLAHEDETMEGYFVYLSPSNKDLKGEFDDVKDDVVVVNNLKNKRTASPLADVLKKF
ncbi:hypothetical protein J6TS7_20770 [Paenibacillus dendritiformis]|uniref:copper amine oxidase N-terminal domain-containing protein n=1 Tax=Paenibacillus TaxID=44249 RepID=UPI001AFFA765|nr:copper amine oxidase N-terminal domain-containing protein [Paenibacillus dendritiformis]GIO78467.1 hypothetical protein J6TS7_20770 [Paenibacillus dendritiformis]